MWWNPVHKEWEDVEPLTDKGTLEVDIEENPIVNVLYGPNGEVLARFSEKRAIPFGFGSSNRG